MSDPAERALEQGEIRGSNPSGVRAHNERLALSLLRARGPTAKADLARLTGLSAQTISVIMRGLEADGLIERGAPRRGRVGQPSVPMRLAAQGAYFLGVKVGRRSADVVLVDFLGAVVAREHLTYPYPTPDLTLGFVREATGRLVQALPAPARGRVSGMGIAMPGYLWEWASEIGAPPGEMEAWRDRDFRAEVAGHFDFPVYLRNDASCACAAELVFGTAAADTPNFLYFYVGHLVGGGVVLNNALYTGPTGNAGALGPLSVPGAGGAQRQLVSVASLVGLEAAVRRAGGDAALLWESPRRWPVAPDILNAWLDEAAGGLAYAVAAACSVIDFEVVVIDGWMPGSVRASLLERTRQALAGVNLSGLVVPELREGTIGAEARPLGAASIPLSQRFLVEPGAVRAA